MADSTDWRRWLSRAEIQFAKAEDVLQKFPSGACLDFHFACELYLKASILFLGHIPVRSHDLEDLLRQINDPTTRPKQYFAAQLLSEVGFKQRYPGEFEDADTEEAAAAFEAAKVLRAYAREKLGLENL